MYIGEPNENSETKKENKQTKNNTVTKIKQLNNMSINKM